MIKSDTLNFEYADKNDKEIYEGDIVLTTPGTFDCLKKYVVERVDDYPIIWSPLNLRDKRTEIVGNIYENPEMING